MYPNIIDFDTALARAQEMHAEAERERLGRAARGRVSATALVRSTPRQRIGELVVQIGLWIGGRQFAAGAAVGAAQSECGCA